MLLLCVLLGGDVFALDPAHTLLQYNCRTWTRQNGLSANAINAIAQTTDEYLWLGTPAGLIRFDGIDFDPFALHGIPGLQSSVVSSVAVSQRPGLWLGVRSGFAFCDGETVTAESREEWGGEQLNVQSILEASNGDLWLAMQTGAARLTAGKKFETILPAVGSTGSYDVSVVYEDSTGRIWLGTTQNGLYFWRDGVVTRFREPALDAVIVRAVVEDKQGRIWIGTQVGLFCYDAELHRLPMTLSPAETSALIVDRQGAVWVGTMGSGLIRYWHDEGATLRKADGLADDFVISMIEDHEGSLWIGTRNGLSQLTDVKMPTLGRAEGIIGEVCVNVSASPRGGLWVATDAGAVRLDGDKQVEAYTSESGLGNNYLLAVVEAANGEIYAINGQRDVLVIAGGKLVARYPNKTWPTALVEDDQGVLVAVDGTLYRATPTTYAPYLLADGQPVSVGYVFDLTLGSDGCIWVAASDGGIVRIKDGEVTRWPVAINGRAATLLWICEDDEGVVWAGSSTGLARLKDGKTHSFTTSDGLFDNVITSIVPDQYGFLWVDSDRGFYRVSRQSLNDLADGKIKQVECTVFDGLDSVKSVERNQQKPAGCKTLDGRIWFPTAQGVVVVDPAKLTRNAPPPTVRIEQVRANGRNRALGSRTGVPPGAGDLEFTYAGLTFISPQKTQYRYKLEGYDPDWVEVGNRRVAAYTNLRPGAYTFRVRAANADGVWSDSGDAVAIELRPHFYQTTWFYFLCGGAALAALTGLYGWRVRHLHRRQQDLQDARDRLEAEVQSRTAELAGANGSLQQEVQGHKWTAGKLAERTATLEAEIEERKRVQLEIERVHHVLLETSRKAGMAEVAISVLHNVGNVLNSVNVSATLLGDRIQQSEVVQLDRVCGLLRKHQDNLGEYLVRDPQGRKVPAFLETLAQQLAAERRDELQEVGELRRNVEHIKEIVAMQQAYARVSGVMEVLPIVELVEDAIQINAGALTRHKVTLARDYQATPTVEVDKHKVLQVLVNLIRNAKYACDESGRAEKSVTIRIAGDEESVQIAVLDNGVGIPAENMARIFNHGFTTRKDGHGFGLHSGALAAKEMGGALSVHSDGPGQGATFILELPLAVLPAAGADAAHVVSP